MTIPTTGATTHSCKKPKLTKTKARGRIRRLALKHVRDGTQSNPRRFAL